MFLVAVLTTFALHGVQRTRIAEQREKEAELLWVGTAYRQAIREYYEGTPGSSKVYPQKLSDLLYDGRQPTPGRPLRKLYRDPMDGNSNWGLVTDAGGRIMGVYSQAHGVPHKKGGFPPEYQNFSNASQYSDWKFVYQGN
jgi:type II secretory pathway pseudopilin PulG